MQKKNKNAKKRRENGKNGGFVRKRAAKIAKLGGLAGKNCEKSKIGS
ncbi:MAG TPA: hypothetical protein IAB07_02665 [Candidatus Caccalectryoclostridium excrementigallinarum]|uniref:Uncharacterized protein n=1 Tax=Candidatus Caccalectryoclostridium excrementigallinarum TaxID=2840710 RepID=A0A9D1MM24_9FIRM|nr:hypothetical protein [Candidatus Caccalectryoclostridium excrementigallinarum]